MTERDSQLRPDESPSLAQILRSSRQGRALTQEEVVKRVNELAIERGLTTEDSNTLPASTFSLWEVGTRIPHLNDINRHRLSLLFEVLGVEQQPLDSLIKTSRIAVSQTLRENENSPAADAEQKTGQGSPLRLIMDGQGINSPELARMILGPEAPEEKVRDMDYQFRAARRKGVLLDPKLRRKAAKALNVRENTLVEPEATVPVASDAKTDSAATVPELELQDLIAGSNVKVHYDAATRKFVDQNGAAIICQDDNGPYVKVRPDPRKLIALIPPEALLDVVMARQQEK